MYLAASIVIKGIPIIFMGLFALCIFFKSQLFLTPITLANLLLVLGIVLVSGRNRSRWGLWLWAVFAVALALRMVFINIWQITPASDCEMAFELSGVLAKTPLAGWHETFAANRYYYDVWPMHVPFVIFQTLCIKLLGNSVVSVQIVNMIFSSLTCVFIALCAEGLTDSKRVGKIAGMFMAFNITTLFMACFLVNQHVSTCFFMAAVCMIIKKPFKHTSVNHILGGILLGIGHLMRPEMYIILIAVLCMLVYEIVRCCAQKKYKPVAGVLFRCLCFTAAFFAVLCTVNSALLNLRWVDNSIMESKLEYKLMIGLNQETEGRFRDEDYPLAANDLAVKEVLRERLSGPVDTAVLMIKKLCFQFSSYNYWWLQADKGGSIRQFVINNIFEPVTQGYMLFMILFAFLASIKTYKNTDVRLLLLYTVYIGFLCAFALMEVQQRYAYITIPPVTVFGAMLFDKGKKRRRVKMEDTDEKAYENV